MTSKIGVKSGAGEFAGNVKDATEEAVDRTGAQFSGAQFSKEFDATLSTLKNGMDEAVSGFERTQTKVREQMGRAVRTTEELVAFQKGNLDAVMKSGQVWANGVQSLSKQVAANAQAQFEDTVSAWKTLTSLRSFKDVVDLQAGYVRNSVEKTMSESSRLTDASFRLVEQTIAPLSARLSLAVEKFSKAV